MLKSIIEFVGPSGSGKSTFAELTAMALQPATVLLVDAAFDQALTKTLCGKAPHQTLTTLVQELLDSDPQFKLATGQTPLTQAAQQAIDWAFHDLPFTVIGEPSCRQPESEIELMTVGLLTEHLPPGIIQAVRYGLTRLFEAHEFIVIDGYHPLLHPMLPEEVLTSVAVCHPQETQPLPTGFSALKTPSLIISQFGSQPMSGQLQTAIRERELMLIGKLPAFSSEEEQREQLPALFQDCLNRMDLPFSPDKSSRNMV